jgi:hypothetical protein
LIRGTVAWPAAASGHRELTGDGRLASRGERGGLLVPDVRPGDPAVAPQRVGKTIERITRQAVNALHAGRLQLRDHDIGDRVSHVHSP